MTVTPIPPIPIRPFVEVGAPIIFNAIHWRARKEAQGYAFAFSLYNSGRKLFYTKLLPGSWYIPEAFVWLPFRHRFYRENMIDSVCIEHMGHVPSFGYASWYCRATAEVRSGLFPEYGRRFEILPYHMAHILVGKPPWPFVGVELRPLPGIWFR